MFTDGGHLFTKFIVFEDRISLPYLLITSNIMYRLCVLDTFSQLDFQVKQAQMSVTAYNSGCDGGGGLGPETIAANSHDERRNLNMLMVPKFEDYRNS